MRTYFTEWCFIPSISFYPPLLFGYLYQNLYTKDHTLVGLTTVQEYAAKCYEFLHCKTLITYIGWGYSCLLWIYDIYSFNPNRLEFFQRRENCRSVYKIDGHCCRAFWYFRKKIQTKQLFLISDIYVVKRYMKINVGQHWTMGIVLGVYLSYLNIFETWASNLIATVSCTMLSVFPSVR